MSCHCRCYCCQPDQKPQEYKYVLVAMKKDCRTIEDVLDVYNTLEQAQRDCRRVSGVEGVALEPFQIFAVPYYPEGRSRRPSKDWKR